MITVKCNINEDECTMVVKGHAGYNPGNDIVCAGCSAIITMLAGYLVNRLDRTKLIKMEMESGNADIHVKGDAVEVFEMAVIGLMQIEKAYPQNVKVILENTEASTNR